MNAIPEKPLLLSNEKTHCENDTGYMNNPNLCVVYDKFKRKKNAKLHMLHSSIYLDWPILKSGTLYYFFDIISLYLQTETTKKLLLSDPTAQTKDY